MSLTPGKQLHRQRCPQAQLGRLDLASTGTTPPDLLLFRLRRLFPTFAVSKTYAPAYVVDTGQRTSP